MFEVIVGGAGHEGGGHEKVVVKDEVPEFRGEGWDDVGLGVNFFADEACNAKGGEHVEGGGGEEGMALRESKRGSRGAEAVEPGGAGDGLYVNAVAQAALAVFLYLELPEDVGGLK